MKFYCVSDNVDTKIGMRLAGIEGEIVHTAEEVQAALEGAAKKTDVDIILVSEKLVRCCPDYITDFKLERKRPLVLAIPDRHGDANISETITNYVRDSIGVKID